MIMRPDWRACLQRLAIRSACGGAILFSAACEFAAVSRFEVKDSAGVRIVSNPPVASVPKETQLITPATVILGGLHDENLRQEFASGSPWMTAIRLSDGRIVAADGTHLKYYSSTGQFIKTVGSKGSGPGEFRSIQGICRFRGDSIVVTDDAQGRVTIIDSSGAIAREYVSPGWVVPNVCFEDGAVLTKSGPVTRRDDGARLAEFTIISSAGGPLTVLPPLPTEQYPLRPVSYAIHDDVLYVGDGFQMAVQIYNRAGRLVSIVRTTDVPRKYTAEEFRSHMGAPTGPGAPRPARRAVASLPDRPMYRQMRVDREGRIWLLLDTYRGANGTWAIFDAAGRLQSRLVIAEKSSVPPRTVHWFGRMIVGLESKEAVVLDKDSMDAIRLSFFQIGGIGYNH